MRDAFETGINKQEKLTDSIMGCGLFAATIGRMFERDHSTEIRRIADIKNPHHATYSRDNDTLTVDSVFFENLRSLLINTYNMHFDMKLEYQRIVMMHMYLVDNVTYALKGHVDMGFGVSEMLIHYKTPKFDLLKCFTDPEVLKAKIITAKPKHAVTEFVGKPFEIHCSNPVAFINSEIPLEFPE